MRCEVEKLLLVQGGRVDRGNLEHALGKGPRLVEDDGLGLGQGFKVVGALHEDAVLGSVSYAPEERKGHREDQRAGARDHEEGKSAQQPRGEGASKVSRDEWRQDCHGDGEVYDDGRIDPGKALDELLGVGLIGAGVLYKVDDLARR